MTDHCAAAQYTLIDYGPTASYVQFIGCMNGQPECCPFTPATTTQGVLVTSQGVYPRPKDAKDAIVNSCPTDYYSVSGSCCPKYASDPYVMLEPSPVPATRLTLPNSSYTPWTAALGGATPCYSTLPPDTTPPTTAGNTIAARATRVTVTVTATVFAMQYAVLDDGAAVSPGGIAGIVIGCALFLGGLLGVFLWFRRRRRRSRKFRRLKAELRGGYGAEPGSSEVPTSPDAPFRDMSPVHEKRISLPPLSDLRPPLPVECRNGRLNSMYAHPASGIRGTSSQPFTKPRPIPLKDPLGWKEIYAHGPGAPRNGSPPPYVYDGRPKLTIQSPTLSVNVQGRQTYGEASSAARPPPPLYAGKPKPNGADSSDSRQAQIVRSTSSRVPDVSSASTTPAQFYRKPEPPIRANTPGQFYRTPPWPPTPPGLPSLTSTPARFYRRPEPPSTTNTPAQFSAIPQPRPIAPPPRIPIVYHPPEHTAGSPLTRQPAIIDRPRAAYRYPANDLMRGELI